MHRFIHRHHRFIVDSSLRPSIWSAEEYVVQYDEKLDEYRGLWPNTKAHSKVKLEMKDTDQDMTLGALLGRGGPQVISQPFGHVVI